MIKPLFAPLILCSASLAIAQESKLPPLLPKLAAPPLLDGKIDPQEWSGALFMGKLPSSDPSRALPDTEAWIALDANNLYVAVRCSEPHPEKIRAVTLGDEIKGSVWNDDSVEVFLDTGNTGKSIYQLVANTEGTLYDSLVINLQQSPTSWNSGATVHTHIGKDRWEIEIAIPLQTLEHKPQRGEVIAVNIGRNRYTTGQRESASFAGESFIFPKNFKRLLVEGPIVTDGLSFISLKRGPFFPKATGLWEFQLLENPAQAKDLSFRFPDSTSAENPALQPGQRFVTIPFAAGEAGTMNQCLVSFKGKELYNARYTLQVPRATVRIAPTKDPLFEELIAPFPEGLAKNGVISWPIELVRPLAPVIPFRTGRKYAPDETPWLEYKRDASTLITTTGAMANEPKNVEFATKYGISWCIFLKSTQAAKMGVPEFGKPGGSKAIWFLDPRSREAYLDNARDAIELAKKNPGIQWLFAGDEVWEKMHQTLLRALDEKEHYPELLAADKEVREKYGFGKYGFPESSHDTNPFRWIATYRWEIEKMNGLAAAVRAMIDKEAPHLKFLSWDCMTGHRPYLISSWGKYFDAVTAQIYPARGENRDHVGFTSRFYTDLSGAREFWPVPHVEHFPASYTAEEVEEILSHAFRGGATGLHLWMGDHINEAIRKSGTSIVDRIGAPERWNVVRSVIDRLTKEPFRVVQPVPDTAILYSNTSYQSTGGPMTFQKDNQCEWLYSLLGPQLRSALRFVDDQTIAQTPEALNAYKVVYIPFMPIADDSEVATLEAYVTQGGHLVVCDPQAFRHRSDGSERQNGAILPPLANKEPRDTQNIEYRSGAETVTLPALGAAHPFAKDSTAKILATADDGEPAIIQKQHGKGNITLFTQNPLQPLIITKPAWLTLFKDLQKQTGATGDHKVWRFRFPTPPPLQIPRPDGICLTGNYFEWKGSEPQPTANSIRGGSYELQNVDVKKLEPTGQPISFKEGRLHDRIQGASAPNDAPAHRYTLPCQSDTPWSIRYTFPQAVQARTLRLFYSGKLPAGTVESSPDGKNWEKVGEWKNSSQTGEKEVNVKEIGISPGRTAIYRLNFEPTGTQRLSLVEIDIWGDE